MRKVTRSKTTGSTSDGVGIKTKTKTVVRKGLGGKTITRTKTKTKLLSPKGTNNADKNVRATKTLKTRTVSRGDQSSTSRKLSTRSNVDNLRENGDVYNKKKRTSKEYESTTGQGYYKPASRNQSISDTVKMAKERMMGNRLK